MKFAAAWWLSGTAVAVLVALFLALGGFALLKATRRFGDEQRVRGLMTASASGRRAVKGVLLVLSVVFGFVALAGPQYGRGTRLIPATNLDVVIALDYSKSMYARDVAPNRTERAKSEVGRLIAQLPGARFGAVAFAGQPISFPLTSDGGAIAQFFRQLTPLDMPVGGTAIARALEAARGLFERDPLSIKHKRVIVLVTDGEDLEGDPVSLAKTAAREEIVIHVVQIGGRSPEAIPEVDENGESRGFRRDSDGKPLTTQLSAAGEEQLTQIASVTAGQIIRSQSGKTGIEEITRSLKSMMTQELAERVETVYADVYAYPLGVAILLLILEALIGQVRRQSPSGRDAKSAQGETKADAKGNTSSDARGSGGRRGGPGKPPRPPAPTPTGSAPRPGSNKERRRNVTVVALLGLLFASGCDQLEQAEKSVFVRHSPVVDQAIAAIETGDADVAASLLQGYLSTGECKEGDIGTPELMRERPSATYDLGLTLFSLGERFGQRFGEPNPGGTPDADQQLVKRSQEVDCALRLVRVIAQDPSVPVELQAHAFYLAGNLEFLREDYEAAVKNYDDCIKRWPGSAEKYGKPDSEVDDAAEPASDKATDQGLAGAAIPKASAEPNSKSADQTWPVGDRAAWNRAIALRRIQEQEKKDPPDAGEPPPDAGQPPDEDQDNEDEDQEDKDKQDDQQQNQDEDEQDDQQQNQDEQKDEQQDDKQQNQDKQDESKKDQGDDKQQQDSQSQDKQEQQQAEQQGQAPAPSLSNDDRILDLLEAAPTLQQEAARKQGGRAVSPGMEDK